mmetsp:Transcript_125643/g.367048  ORF Transcript_125643/g.367048 Transcript_125643/m.367048 type:complete len:279 (-) Transcript_125643:271-1107(-)
MLVTKCAEEASRWKHLLHAQPTTSQSTWTSNVKVAGWTSGELHAPPAAGCCAPSGRGLGHLGAVPVLQAAELAEQTSLRRDRQLRIERGWQRHQRRRALAVVLPAPALLRVLVVACQAVPLSVGQASEEEQDEHGPEGAQERGPGRSRRVGVQDHRGGGGPDAPPHGDLAKVVGVPRDAPEAAGAELPPVRRVRPEAVLLDVGRDLQDEAKDEGGPPQRVPGAQSRLLRPGHRVDEDDGQGAEPRPQHLADPEDQEPPEVLPRLVEARVLLPPAHTEE